MEFFHTLAVSESYRPNDDVTIVFADGDLATVLQGRAPATGITIDQKVDYSISKSLKKDFIIDTFGDSPVRIILEGLTIVAELCSGVGNNSTTTMEDFYAANKLSAGNTKRVTVGLSDKRKFICVLTDLRSNSSQDNAKYGLIHYTLGMIGVEQ